MPRRDEVYRGVTAETQVEHTLLPESLQLLPGVHIYCDN